MLGPDMCRKILAGKRAQVTTDFMIIARIESLILEMGIDDAVARSELAAGAHEEHAVRIDASFDGDLAGAFTNAKAGDDSLRCGHRCEDQRCYHCLHRLHRRDWSRLLSIDLRFKDGDGGWNLTRFGQEEGWRLPPPGRPSPLRNAASTGLSSRPTCSPSSYRRIAERRGPDFSGICGSCDARIMRSSALALGAAIALSCGPRAPVATSAERSSGPSASEAPRAPGPDAPPLDSDHDGIADVDDLCPHEAESPNAYEDADGCFDQYCQILYRSVTCAVEPIFFKKGSAKLSPNDEQALQEMVAALARHQHIDRVVFKGHIGANELDGLALRRARAVVDRLVAIGVSPDRVAAASEPRPAKMLHGAAYERRVDYELEARRLENGGRITCSVFGAVDSPAEKVCK